MSALTINTNHPEFVLVLSCPDNLGIVAQISSFLTKIEGWILEASYHADAELGWFYTRQKFRLSGKNLTLKELEQQFAPIAAKLGSKTSWRIIDSTKTKKIVILVSKERHCLHDLLERVIGENYPAKILAVIGNHDELAAIPKIFNIPFHYVDFPKANLEKRNAFNELKVTIAKYEPDTIVLAKFMQILPPDLCELWRDKTINIHHSFLPSFIGARPYKQAYQRGVKLIGATCHYVTADLDAGPIIEQDVTRISHSDNLDDIIRKGRDVERQVLARGLRWHLEDRVLVSGTKTIIFK